MAKRNVLTIVSLAALILPGMLLLASARLSVFVPSVWDGVVLVLLNWLILVSPQLLVLVLALAFPRLRARFAPIALVSLTLLLLVFECVVFWFSDPNDPMLFMFYFALSVLILLALALAPSRRSARL